MFSELLLKIENDLHNLKSREEIIEKNVKYKLNKSVEVYQNYLQRELEYLLSRKNAQVINNIEREHKKEERKLLYEQQHNK